MGVFDRKIKIFTDGAVLSEMLEWRDKGIKGFTTNPTLMRKAGITDYEVFARQVLCEITDLPVSFEVFSDDFGEMERQARLIASWGENVYVKIPITNTKGEWSIGLIRQLTLEVKLNVTAMLTYGQAIAAGAAVVNGRPSFISIFAGRIADTQRDPVPIMERTASWLMAHVPQSELIWASPREVLNVQQAQDCGCHVITATPDVLKKLELQGKDLEGYSLDTVRMFYQDAQAAGFQL